MQCDSDFEDADEGDDTDNDEDNSVDESDEQRTSSKTPQVEWDSVTLKRLNCSLLVHEHTQFFQLKPGINIHVNRAFSRK